MRLSRELWKSRRHHRAPAKHRDTATPAGGLRPPVDSTGKTAAGILSGGGCARGKDVSCAGGSDNEEEDFLDLPPLADEDDDHAASLGPAKDVVSLGPTKDAGSGASEQSPPSAADHMPALRQSPIRNVGGGGGDSDGRSIKWDADDGVSGDGGRLRPMVSGGGCGCAGGWGSDNLSPTRRSAWRTDSAANGRLARGDSGELPLGHSRSFTGSTSSCFHRSASYTDLRARSPRATADLGHKVTSCAVL